MRQTVQLRRLLVALGSITLAVGGGLAWKSADPSAREESRAPIPISPRTIKASSANLPAKPSWRDSRGDGFPDMLRLAASDRENFVRWMTFLGEAQYYREGASARGEIRDCAALIRFAMRNTLAPHTAAWRRTLDLPYEPGFGSISKYSYPDWPLGRGLFRTRAGPFAATDLGDGTFAVFADSQTLMRDNTFFVSRDLGAAEPADLLFYDQPDSAEPYHSMLFVGRSYFQPRGSDWIVYHTGELANGEGEIREVKASVLLRHPDPRWRPAAANPRFLGVYRLNILH